MILLKRIVFLMAILLCLTGCLESSFQLSEDSRLPTWFDIPDGMRRGNFTVQMELYSTFSGGEVVIKLFKKNELFHEENKAITLAKEIKAQLIDDEHQREMLNLTTEKRLIRWAHPARVDDRTRFVKPRAREICMTLFGFIPERKD